MKLAAQILAFDINQWLPHVVENASIGVDKIFMVRPLRPWKYNLDSRSNISNPTTVDDLIKALSQIDTPSEVVEGDWETEEEMRNECLSKIREQDFDWCIIQDADEFYEENSWSQIRRALSLSPENQVATTWFNFWKSPEYVLVNKNGEIKDTNACFAVRAKSNVTFISARRTNPVASAVLDIPCYHYGYCMSNERMLTKISTWAHANHFNRKRWYRLKWENWSPETRNLHPTHPENWYRAIRFPLHQPKFAIGVALSIGAIRMPSKSMTLSNIYYDFKVSSRRLLRAVKKTFLSSNSAA